MTGIIRKWNNLLDNESSTFRRIPIANFGLQLKFHCFRQKFRSLISYNHFTRPQILLFLKIYFISNRIFFTRNKIVSNPILLVLVVWVPLLLHYFTKQATHDALSADLSSHFSPMFHFYTPWKRQKTKGFLTFSRGHTNGILG